MFASFFGGCCTKPEEEKVEVVPTTYGVAADRGLWAHGVSDAKEANPPAWPASVHIVEPDGRFQGDKQAFFDQLFTDGGKYSTHPWGAEHPNTDRYGGYFNETGRDFDSKRTAVFLKPGVHKAKFNVGFYNSLYGLGRHPDAVELDSFEVLNGVGASGIQTGLDPGALNNFWRSVENLKTTAGNTVYYFVSQASPLRKVHIQGQLRLAGAVGGGIYDWGYASGGFTADCKVDGGVEFGGQQQYVTRNSEIPPTAALKHGAWSNVLIGVHGEYIAEANQSCRLTKVESTERIAEKPYIMYDDATGRYFLMVPQSETNKVGITWQRYNDDAATKKIDFEHVYVADPATATAAVINGKLLEGKSVVFAPGIFKLQEPIVVSRNDAVLLGIGMASIMPAEDAPWMDSLIHVADSLQGVRISGLLLEAGTMGCQALLKWGTRPGAVGLETGYMHDIFCRVGGDRDACQPEVRTNCMVEINSSNVVGDNLWLWRADHCIPGNVGVKDSRNKVWNALRVLGDGVIMYGLFTEHALHDQVVWEGEKGKTFFFQCELPYDVTQQNFGDLGYGGYIIGDHVKQHALHGAGVYTYFRDHEVTALQGFRAPEAQGITLDNLFTVFLNGKGGCQHVLNKKGGPCNSTTQGRPVFLEA